ncbi:MAG TPA: BamA/TamA family outer membrane protein [Chryseolinea sp.]
MRAYITCVVFCLLASDLVAQQEQIGLPDTIQQVPIYTRLDSVGRLIHINRVFIVGNRITRDQIILRELTLRQGDVINSLDLEAILERDKKKLINTRLFNTVEIRPLELQQDHIDLLIDLDERWYTFPSPIFELSDRNFNEWWETYDHDFSRVNYGLRLYQFNMRGRNETLRLTAQFGFQRRFELSYRFPYIDKKQKHGLIIDADFTETKNLAFRTVDHRLDFLKDDNILRTTRGGGVTYTYRNSFYVSHALKLEYRSNSINDTIPSLNSNYYSNDKTTQRYGMITYQFISDHRDYVGYPLRGSYFTLLASKSGIAAKDDLNKWEATASYSIFLDLTNNFFLSNNIIGYVSTPDDVPYSNYGAMGYRKQFARGYEIYVIEGTSYALNKLTLKKRIFHKVYRWESMPIPQFRHVPLSIFIKTYGDLGYVKGYPNYEISSRLSDKLLTSAGGGVDIVASYDVVLRIEYTFNGEGEKGFFFHIRKEF